MLSNLQNDIIASVTDAGARFAIVKRGSVINHKWMNFSPDGKILWILLANLISWGPGDRMLNAGIVEAPIKYFRAFNLSDEQIVNGMRELVKAGYVKRLDENVYQIRIGTPIHNDF